MPGDTGIATVLSPAAVGFERNACFRGRISEFDGLRAVISAVVIVCHFWKEGQFPRVWNLLLLGGWVAMDAFFVLSGFLITGILLDSRSNQNYYRSFYVRRSLRIFPLYYFVLISATIITALSVGATYFRSLAWFFLYVGNLRMAASGTRFVLMILGPLWSLQVEEQFYILYPLLVKRVRTETLQKVLWGLVFVSPALRIIFYFVNPSNAFLQYVLLPCRMEGLALGGLIAIRLRQGPWEIDRIKLSVATVGILTAVFVASARDGYAWWFPFNRTVGFSFSSFACALLVLSLIEFRGSRFTAWFRLPPVTYLGKISYGIYILQMPALFGFEFISQKLRWNIEHGSTIGILAPVAITIIAASFSWHGLELPMLRLKNRLAHSS